MWNPKQRQAGALVCDIASALRSSGSSWTSARDVALGFGISFCLSEALLKMLEYWAVFGLPAHILTHSRTVSAFIFTSVYMILVCISCLFFKSMVPRIELWIWCSFSFSCVLPGSLGMQCDAARERSRFPGRPSFDSQ